MVIGSESISGNLKSLDDWIWDPFNFDAGEIGDAPYHFVALDFTDNDYSYRKSVIVYNSSNPNDRIELVDRDDKRIVIEVRSAADDIVVTQTDAYGHTLTQILDLSSIVLL